MTAAPPPAPRPNGPRAAAQLLYTNVDRVADGRAVSGWQTMEVSAGLDEAGATLMRGLIEPSLNPLRPLPGFPTPEEIGAAERRFAQVPTGIGTVLVHTAPAGVDTTGRPNTMSHLVLLPDEPAPALMTADLWRSPGWVAPFGPDRVRGSSLPDPAALVAGSAVDDDAVADFVAAAPRGPVLGAMADALQPRVLARVDGRAPDEAADLVVVACASTDEAALWVGALQRTCAPATGRLLGFSTLERLTGSGDLERLSGMGLDLVFVPPPDLEAVWRRTGALVVDPDRPPSTAPITGWGRLVAAVCQDRGAWMAGTVAQREVMGLLADHRDLSPAWPLAVAEACDPGLLADELDDVVECELVDCQPSALIDQPYLSSIISERVLGSDCREPADWWRRLAAVPANAPVTGLVDGLVSRYLRAASQSASWLLDERREPPPAARRALNLWSAQPQCAQAVERAVEDMICAVEADGPDGAARLRLADGLVRDGLVLPPMAAKRLFAPACRALLSPNAAECARMTGVRAGQATRAHVLDRVEQLLRAPAPAEPRRLPSVGAPALEWLTRGLSTATAPLVEAELCACALLGTTAPLESATERLLRALEAAAAMAPRPGPLRLAGALAAALGATLAPAQAVRLPALVTNREDVLAAVMLTRPDDPLCLRTAAQDLRQRGHDDADLASTRYPGFSLWTSVRLLVHSQELAGLTAPAPDACTRALNVLAAVAVVSRDAALGGLPAVAPARDKALATVLVGLWADIQIGPLPPACADAPLLDALPERLAAQPQILAGPGETGLGPNLPRVINRLFWSAKGRRIPEDWLDSVDRDLRALEATEAAGDPLLIGRYEAVLAICRAWVSLLGPEAADPVAEELAAFSGEPPGFDKWLARTVLSAMSRPTGLRRLFGAR